MPALGIVANQPCVVLTYSSIDIPAEHHNLYGRLQVCSAVYWQAYTVHDSYSERYTAQR